MRKCQNSTLEFKVENLKGGNSASRSVTRTHRRWSRAAAHRKAGEQQEPLRGFPLSSTQNSVQSVQSRAKKNLITSLWAWELSPLFSFTCRLEVEGKRGGGRGVNYWSCWVIVFLNKKKREGKEEKSDSACQVIAVALTEKEKMTVGIWERSWHGWNFATFLLYTTICFMNARIIRLLYLVLIFDSRHASCTLPNYLENDFYNKCARVVVLFFLSYLFIFCCAIFECMFGEFLPLLVCFLWSTGIHTFCFFLTSCPDNSLPPPTLLD